MSPAGGRELRLTPEARARADVACKYVNAELGKIIPRLIKAGVWTLVITVPLLAIALRTFHPLFLAPAMLVAFVVGGRDFMTLRSTFKKVAVSRVVNALDAGLTYRPEPGITLEQFAATHLVKWPIDAVLCEDEVSGSHNGIPFSIMEANATRNEGSGKNRRRVTSFRGELVKVDFNKRFTGHTIVVPNSESQILGGLFGEAESRRDTRIARMENPEFEQAFSVYTTDDQQARYILTPKLMDLILEAHRKFGDLRLAFFQNEAFIGIPRRTNRFELTPLVPVTPESVLGELIEAVNLVESLIDILDLETRIWSKA